jgi:ATP-dependent DNA ligase
LFFKHAAELGLEGIVSKRAASLYRGGPSKNSRCKNRLMMMVVVGLMIMVGSLKRILLPAQA